MYANGCVVYVRAGRSHCCTTAGTPGTAAPEVGVLFMVVVEGVHSAILLLNLCCPLLLVLLLLTQLGKTPRLAQRRTARTNQDKCQTAFYWVPGFIGFVGPINKENEPPIQCNPLINHSVTSSSSSSDAASAAAALATGFAAPRGSLGFLPYMNPWVMSMFLYLGRLQFDVL